MKKLLILILVAFMFSGCTAQNSEQKATANEPQVNIEVNKEYDDKGNLIRYDSTYTYAYSSGEDSVKVDMDTLFSRFKPFFFDHYRGITDRPFEDFFEKDSLYYHDFFNDNYYYDRFQQRMQHFDAVFREMDSLKNQYFKEEYPELQQGLENPEQSK